MQHACSSVTMQQLLMQCPDGQVPQLLSSTRHQHAETPNSRCVLTSTVSMIRTTCPTQAFSVCCQQQVLVNCQPRHSLGS
jgi:hypothetical protein